MVCCRRGTATRLNLSIPQHEGYSSPQLIVCPCYPRWSPVWMRCRITLKSRDFWDEGMSADKLEAVHEALADVFNESNLNATSTETSHAAFDHKTLSEAFSEPHLNVANTEQSFARFEHAALKGMFGEPSTEKPPPTSFDQSFADLLSGRPPLASDTHQPRPGFDHQGFAEILSEPPTVSTNTKPSQPSFDHQALAEMLTKSRADPINPPTSAPQLRYGVFVFICTFFWSNRAGGAGGKSLYGFPSDQRGRCAAAESKFVIGQIASHIFYQGRTATL